MTRGWWVAQVSLTAIAGIVGLGCGAEVGDAGEAVERTEGALGESGEPADVPATCSPEDLSWGDGGACAGPWEYQRRDECWQALPVGTTAGAEHSTCTQWATCANWCFGAAAGTTWTPDGSATITVPRRCEVECVERPRGGRTCTKPICRQDFEQAQETCNERLATRVETRRASYPAEARPLLVGRATATLLGASGTQADQFRCQYELRLPNPRSGTGSLCGCATTTRYRPVACDSRPPTATEVLSSGGLSLASLLSEDADAYVGAGSAAPSCTTCEQLPARTPDEVRAKYECLCASWNRIPGVTACGSASASTTTTTSSVARFGAATLGTVVFDGVLSAETSTCSNQTTYVLPSDDAIVDDRGAGRGALDASQIPGFVRHFRLLAELGGDHLSPAARAHVNALVQAHPEAVHACSVASSTEVPASCPLRDDLQPWIDRCERFAQPHVSSEVATIEAPGCLALLDTLGDLEPSVDASCDGATLRAATRQTTTTILAKALRSIELAPSSPYASLPRQLHGLSRWWASFSASHAVDAYLELEVDPRGTLSEMLGRFWSHATEGRALLTQLREGLAADATEEELALAVEGMNAPALALDRDVLVAAFAPITELPAIVEGGVTVLGPVAVGGSPLRGMPLLAVTGDALGRIDARLDAVVELHDFACRFHAQRCRGAFHSPTERLVALVASIGASSAAEELSATTDALDGWRDVLAAIDAGRAALVEALAEHEVEDFDQVGVEHDPTLAALASIVQEQRARIGRFRTDGLFDATERRAITLGASPNEVSAVLTRMGARVEAVSQERVRYTDALDQVAAGLVNAAGTSQARTALQNQMDELHARRTELRADEEGLLASAEVERRRLGEMTAELPALDEGQIVPIGDTMNLSLTGGDAMFALQPDPTASELAAASLAGQAASGVRLLSIETRGQWSPTCSLRRARAIVPSGTGRALQELGWEGALTGPEGFVVTSSAGTAQVSSAGTSWDRSRTRTEGTRGQTCFSAGISTDGLFEALQMPPLFSVGFSGQDCDFEETSTSNRTGSSGSNVSSSDRRTGASYAAGLRLPNTPFPNAPVGSLLAFVVPRGETYLAQYTDVHVVTAPHTTILLPEESDVHVVVNDEACAEADTLRALNVTVRPLTTAGAIAERVVAAMQVAVERARELRSTYVAQGTVLPGQAQLVRSSAIAELERADVGIPFASLPAALQTLFSAHLDLVIVDLERHVRIDANRREQKRIAMQLASLRDELAHVERRGRLSLLVPLRHLHTASERHLRAQLDDLVADTERFLLPIMALWFPESLEMPSGLALQAAVADLLAARTTTRFDTLVGKMTTVLDDALARLTTAQAWNRPSAQHVGLALTWPRAGAPTQSASSFRRASTMPTDGLPPRASVDPWVAVRDAGLGAFRVRPEDLYSRSLGVSGVLWCHESVPVISAMALFVGRPGSAGSINDVLTNQDLTVGGWIENMAFQTEGGLESYAVLSTAAQQFRIPLIFGQPHQAFEVFNRKFPVGTNPGAPGLSPFADFVVDFRGLAEQRQIPNGNDGFTRLQQNGERVFEATEMTLVMRVDSREIAMPMPGVDRCEPPAELPPEEPEEPADPTEPPTDPEEPPTDPEEPDLPF